MHQIAPNYASSFKIFPGVTPRTPILGRGDTLSQTPPPLGASRFDSWPPATPSCPPESFILPPETNVSIKALSVTADITWDLCFKQALQFQKKTKTKRRQIWPSPWTAKGPATPVVLWASVLNASRLLVRQRGTVCRQNSRTRHWPLDSSLSS